MAGLLQDCRLIGNEIPWLQQLRQSGLTAFEAQGIPTAKTEAWKYTKLRSLAGSDFVMNCQAISFDQPSHPEIPFDSYRICFNNGVFDPCHSELPQGVEVLPLIEAVMLRPESRHYLGRLVDLEHYPFAALNTAYLNEGVFIRIEKNVELKKPLLFIHHTEVSENLFFNLRNLIILEEGASAKFVEYYHYSGAMKSCYFANIVNEIYLSAHANLQHYKFQNEAYKAFHIALSVVEVGSAGHYQSFTLQKGADIARNETLVKLTAENAKAEVNAAYLMNGWATIDNTTDIEHLSPCTFSGQLVKGVVGGDAKGVFQGKIHIAPKAVKTEGRQLHKALLMSDSAEIDVKPELEIFADDVKCSHGAASGELDEEAMFYMRSRGISEDDAKQLLIDAYLEDVMATITDPAIRVWFRGLK